MKSNDKQNLPHSKVNTPSNAAAFMPYQQALAAGAKQNNSDNECSSDEAVSGSNNVEVVSKDGVVDKILVTCKCGEVIEIECDYTVG